jgi:hypothetical protein
MRDVTERFWQWVDTSSGDCWTWTGGSTTGGYGKFWLNGRTISAHRVSYVMHFGTIPDGLLVLHSCDNPPCVRPDHLSLGTYRDNARDSMAKGRFRPPEPWPTCGNGHPWTEDTEYVHPELVRGYRQRRCRVCARARERERRLAQKGGQA